jgi:YHS domain-containing protein
MSDKVSCEYCDELFSKYGIANHKRGCDQNPDKDVDSFREAQKKSTVSECGEIRSYIVTCDSNKCDEEFTVEEREKQFPKKDNYFCSNSCARSFSTQGKREEINKKVSESLLRKKDCTSVAYSNCSFCGQLIVDKSGDEREFCSLHCLGQFHKDSEEFSEKVRKGIKNSDCEFGGYRKGSGKGGRGKSGSYNGDYFHSSWELAFQVFHDDHGIPLQRCWEQFPYQWKGEERIYVPDFKYNDHWHIEVKGYQEEKDKAKWRDFPHHLEVLKSDEIEPILDYVKSEYGRDFCEKLYKD